MESPFAAIRLRTDAAKRYKWYHLDDLEAPSGCREILLKTQGP